MTPTRASLSALPLLLMALASPAGAETRPAWEVGTLGTAQYNPSAKEEGAARFGAGFAARVLYAVGQSGSIGLHLDMLWLIADDETREFDASQRDLLFVGRMRLGARRSLALHGDVGLGVSQYQGMVDIPETPGCFGCGRYGDTGYAPTLQAGLNLDVALGRGVFLTAGTRASIALFRNEKTDIHNFLPPSLAVRLDLGLGTRF